MSTNIRTQMWKAMADSPYVMLSLNNESQHAEPMRAQLDEDAHGHFWFYTTNTNRVAKGGQAMAQFASKDHKVFACICGTLIEETDADIIDKYWSKQVSAWYKDGRQDKSLKMLRFELSDAEVWKVDAELSGLVKLMIGKKVDPSEMGDHAKIPL